MKSGFGHWRLRQVSGTDIGSDREGGQKEQAEIHYIKGV